MTGNPATSQTRSHLRPSGDGQRWPDWILVDLYGHMLAAMEDAKAEALTLVSGPPEMHALYVDLSAVRGILDRLSELGELHPGSFATMAHKGSESQI